MHQFRLTCLTMTFPLTLIACGSEPTPQGVGFGSYSTDPQRQPTAAPTSASVAAPVATPAMPDALSLSTSGNHPGESGPVMIHGVPTFTVASALLGDGFRSPEVRVANMAEVGNHHSLATTFTVRHLDQAVPFTVPNFRAVLKRVDTETESYAVLDDLRFNAFASTLQSFLPAILSATAQQTGCATKDGALVLNGSKGIVVAVPLQCG